MAALWVGCLAAGAGVLWVWPAGVGVSGLPYVGFYRCADVQRADVRCANVVVAVAMLVVVLGVVIWKHRVLE